MMRAMERYLCLQWISLVFSFSSVTFGQTHQVDTNVGTIQGSLQNVKLHTDIGVTVQAECVQYLGIPYAEPPVEARRFQRPVYKARLESIHNGTFYRPICHQGTDPVDDTAIHMNNVQISEDCLTLDIYAPIGTTTGEDIYPVLVVIHGGSFVSGGSNGFIGDTLTAAGQTVVVVMNFRLAVLGFFSTGDDNAPGNYGLWDQQLAIYWVKQNIGAFGGDVDRITVLGSSSGSASALLQAMYPPNKGLFYRVIAESGSPVPTYKISSFLGKPTGTAVLEAVGCTYDSTEQMLACMRNKSLREIDEGLQRVGYSISFTPVIDGEFIAGAPDVVLNSNDPDTADVRNMFASVDLLIGVNGLDGGVHVTFMWAPLLDQDFNTLQVNRTVFNDFILPTALQLFLGNISDAVQTTVQFQYTNLKDPDNLNETRRNMLDLSSDIDFFIPNIKTANLHSSLSRNKSTYFYHFSTKLSLENTLTPSWFSGSNHGDEVHFWLGFSQRYLDAWSHLTNFEPTEAERSLSRRMVTWWTNFAATGNPNTPVAVDSSAEWREYDAQTSSYLDIGLHAAVIHDRFREPFSSFWLHVVPSILSLSGCQSDDATPPAVTTSDENICSERFNISSLMTDNILTVLIIASCVFLLAFIIVCSLSVARFNNVDTYDVKTI